MSAAHDAPREPRVRRAYAETPLGQLHYREGGDPAGEPVVLLHQTASSSIQWSARVMPVLPDGIRAIAMDTPGFGMSDRPRPAPGMAWYASRVRVGRFIRGG